MIIHRAEKRHIPALIELLRELFFIEKDFEFNPDKQRNGLSLIIARPASTACIFVAEQKGRCVGMVTAQMVVSTAEGSKSALIEDMVIHKDNRGRGIGSRLLSAVESWCKIHGIGRMQLLADKNNLPALRFYEKRGWRLTQLVAYRKYTGIERRVTSKNIKNVKRTDKKKFRELFRDCRLMSHFSCIDVSRKLEVDRRDILGWEKGISLPSETMLAKIAKLFSLHLGQYRRMKIEIEKEKRDCFGEMPRR